MFCPAVFRVSSPDVVSKTKEILFVEVFYWKVLRFLWINYYWTEIKMWSSSDLQGGYPTQWALNPSAYQNVSNEEGMIFNFWLFHCTIDHLLLEYFNDMARCL